MRILSIDNSIHSPGIIDILLDDSTLEIIKHRFFSATTIKKYTNENDDTKIVYIKNKEKESTFSKICFLFDIIKNWIELDKTDIDYVVFEDYSYNSVGMVFNIAESTGLLKHYFISRGAKMRLYSIPCIKKYATGSGNADKIKLDEFYELEINKSEYKFALNTGFPELYLCKSSPKDNLTDAYWIMRMFLDEIAIRNNKNIEKIEKHRYSLLNEKKKTDSSYTTRDFIQRKCT